MRQCGITRRLHSNLGRSTSSDSREEAWDCAGEDLLPAIHSRLMLLHAHTQVCVISLCFPRGEGFEAQTLPDLVSSGGDFSELRLSEKFFSPSRKVERSDINEKPTTVVGYLPPRGNRFLINQPGIVSLSILQPTDSSPALRKAKRTWMRSRCWRPVLTSI